MSNYRLFMSPLNIHALMDTFASMEDEGVRYLNHWLMTPDDLKELRQRGESAATVGYWVLGIQEVDEKKVILDA